MSRERVNRELSKTVPDMPSFPPVPAQSGWICPKCGNVLAPFMAYCVHCAGREVTPLTEPFDPERTGGIPPYSTEPKIFC